MIQLIRREFEVQVPFQQAWDHLARVRDWPTWAPHIREIVLEPAGPLGPDSRGLLRLAGGIRSAFHMTTFDPPQRWTWRGKFLWLTIDYDHAFEPVSADRTRLVWTVEAAGFGSAVIGRLFAAIYNRNLNRAVPRLIEQMQPH